MKKLFIGCIAVIAVLMGLAGCDSERTTYEGPNYLMFSDTLYRYAVQETGEVFNVPSQHPSCLSNQTSLV